MNLSPIDLYRLKWFLGVFLAMWAFWAVPLADVDAELAVYLLYPVLVLGFLFPKLPALAPSWLWKSATPVLVVAITADFVWSGADFIPPLVRMLVMLTALRALQPRESREDLQLILLATFVVVATGVLSLELSFALQVLVFTPAVMLTLFIVNLGDELVSSKDQGAALWQGFRWGRFLGRVREAIDRRFLLLCSGLFAFLLGAVAAFFVALPRFELGQSLPFLKRQASSSLVGLSENVSFGDVVSILDDESVAMRVDVPTEEPPQELYWRTVVLDEYRNGSFRTSASAKGMTFNRWDFRFDVFQDLTWQPEDSEPWVCYLEGGVTRYLPTPGLVDRITFQNRSRLETNPVLRTHALNETNASVFFYRLDGVGPTDTFPATVGERKQLDELSAIIGGTDARGMSEILTYPDTTRAVPGDSVSQAVLTSVVEVILQGRTLSTREFAREAVNVLRAGRGYSLEVQVPSGPGDTVIRWLNRPQPGHCELYAGSFVLVARQAGFPARMVVGLYGGDWNAYEGYLMLRNRHAHAWCEIYDAEEGWIRVDPTPGGVNRGLGGDEEDSELAGGTRMSFIDDTFGAYLDSLRILWYRRVVNFDQQQQEELVMGLRSGMEGLADRVATAMDTLYFFLRDWWQSPWDVNKVLRLLVVCLVLAAFFYGVRWLGRGLMRGFGDGERRLSWQREEASRWLRRLSKLEAQGLSSDGSPVGATRKALQEVRYGNELYWPDTDTVFGEARQVVRRLKRGPS